MSEQQNVALVQEFYAALKRGNLTGVLNTLAGDVSWSVPGPLICDFQDSFRVADDTSSENWLVGL